MIDIPMPRLIDGKTLEYKRTIRPIKATVELNITPLSTASLELPEDETLNARDFVEMFTAQGSAGIYRIRSPQNSYGDEESSVSELEHAITEVGDYLVTADFDEMMPAQEAMKAVFSYYRGKLWKLGSISALSREIAVNVQYENVLTAMLGILEQIPPCYLSFDFSTKPWTVNISRRGTSVSAEGRLSRNVQSARIVYDDSELCTRAYFEYDTGSDDDDSTAWASKDADTLSKWGVVEKKVSTGSDYTYNEARIIVDDYLEKHKNPKISIEISAEDLSSVTGETFDKFQIGKLCRLALPAYGVTVEETITAISWDDVYGNPTSMSLRLGEEEVTTVSFIHESETSSSESSKSSSRSSSKQKEQWKEYYTDFDKQDKYIKMTATRVDEQNNILQQAGLYLDSNGVLQYAKDEERGLYSQIHLTAEGLEATFEDRAKGLENLITVTAESLTSTFSSNINDVKTTLSQTADSISAVVEGTGKNAKVKPAVIKAAIVNKNGRLSSEIKIDADNILIGSKNARTVIEGKLDTKNLSSEISTLEKVNVKTISSERGSASFATVIAKTKLEVRGVDCSSLASGIKDVRIVPSGNNYILQKSTYYNTSWQDVYTFSRAITRADWSWSGGMAKVVLQPQNQTYYSKALDDYYPGTRYWYGSRLYLPVTVYDTAGTDVLTRDLDVTGVYDAGAASVTPEHHTFAGYFTRYGSVSVEGQTYMAYITNDTSAAWSHQAVYV